MTINIKHGKRYTRVYRIWASMKQRCHNKNHKHYHYYKRKNIFVCNEWFKFENFYKDMGDPPISKHSIDRIDNSKSYYKNNCRWTTIKENAQNKDNSYYWIINNIEYNSAEDAATSYNVCKETIRQWCIKKKSPKHGWICSRKKKY